MRGILFCAGNIGHRTTGCNSEPIPLTYFDWNRKLDYCVIVSWNFIVVQRYYIQ